MKNSSIISIPLVASVSLLTLSAAPKETLSKREFVGPGSYSLNDSEASSITIPFRMHHRKPLLDLAINGEPSTLMIDNGVLWDEVWLFGSPLVETLALEPIEEGMIGGAGEGDPTDSYTSSNLELDFGDIVFHDQPVIVSPTAAGFTRMFPGADGQLCNTFFRHFIVEFDFVQRTLTLHKPEQFRYKGKGSVIEMQLNESGTHSIPFSFTMMDGKTYTNWVDIDFGGIYPLKIALNDKNQIRLPKQVEATASYGAQGRSNEYRGWIQSMTIGDYTFKEVSVVFGDAKTSRIHPENLGVVGLPLFMKFDIIFDYFNNKIYLEPNKDFNEPFM